MRAGRARVELERRPARGEVADDRVLDAGVERGDPRAVPLARGHPRLRDRHLAREVAADHARLGGDPLARLGLAHLAGEDAAAHRARLADVAYERAGVDAVDARDSSFAQPVEPALVGRG